ncbi:MAG: hypothetical protein ACI841_002876 [Planctomycetota bacterium]|jgi:hypothetical protein
MILLAAVAAGLSAPKLMRKARIDEAKAYCEEIALRLDDERPAHTEGRQKLFDVDDEVVRYRRDSRIR